MSERNDERQVRPIPIEDDPGLPLAGHQRRRRRNRRPWLPLVIGWSASTPDRNRRRAGCDRISGSDHGRSERVVTRHGRHQPHVHRASGTAGRGPGDHDRLKLVTTSKSVSVTLVWDPSFRVAEVYVMRRALEGTWLSAAFDAGGRIVATMGITSPDTRPQDVWLGTVTEIDPVPNIADAWSVAWHASEIERLALRHTYHERRWRILIRVVDDNIRCRVELELDPNADRSVG